MKAPGKGAGSLWVTLAIFAGGGVAFGPAGGAR